LDAGAEQAHTAFARDPETELELLAALGNIDDALGDTERSDKIWVQRLNVARALYGAGDPRVIDATTDLAWRHAYSFREEDAKALLALGRKAEAAALADRALQAARDYDAPTSAYRTGNGPG